MTIISKSTIDPRTLTLVLFSLGATTIFLGILGWNLVVLFSGIGVASIGLLVFIFGKSTYSVSYDQTMKTFSLENRKESITINKDDVLSVRKRITFFQTWWPFPRHYFYELSVKNSSGEEKHYQFVIWSNQPNLTSNYKMLERSVATWRGRNGNSED